MLTVSGSEMESQTLNAKTLAKLNRSYRSDFTRALCGSSLAYGFAPQSEPQSRVPLLRLL
jgi:hypothetical protein